MIAVPMADRVQTVSAHFGEAPHFAFVTVQRADGVIIERRSAANPFAQLGRAKGIRVAEWLVAEKVDVVLSREELHGKGPAYVLRDAGVELVRSDARTLDEAIAQCPGAQRQAG
jgi:predicted Fe-Mo cluster-binding NifX family protein